MDMPKVLIHLGYPKTASTFLQKKFFPNDKLGFSLIQDDIFDCLIDCDDFDFSPEKVQEYYYSLFTKTHADNLMPVISRETLSMRFYRSTYQRILSDRFYQVFPNAKIFFFIREQMSAIYSVYNQSVKGDYHKTIEQFIEDSLPSKTNKILKANIKKISATQYRFDLLTECYQKNYGPDNVLVLPFEMLKRQPVETLEKIMKFAEVKIEVEKQKEYLLELLSEKDTNKALKAGILDLKSKINKMIFYPNPETIEPYKWLFQLSLTYKIARVFELIIPEKIHQAEEKRIKSLIEKNYGNLYQESNRRTSELIGIDLSEYGYRM
jgi:hypothetical protein